MARIELRDCAILIQDGLSGSANVAETTPGAADTDVDIDTVNLNSTDVDLVPIGARFTVNTAGNTLTYTVQERTGTNEVQTINIDQTASSGNFTLNFDGQVTANLLWNSTNAAVAAALEGLSTIGANNVTVTGGPGPDTDWVVTFAVDLVETDCNMIVGANVDLDTGNVVITETTKGGISPVTNVVFSPAWGVNTPSQNDVITFISQRLKVKIGEGNLTWTESKEYEYLLDRGDLDTVREGDEQPVDVSLEFVYEYVTTETGKDITPVDAIKQVGEATEWVSSSDDLCEPYAIDMVVIHCLPCGTDQDERASLTNFRWESLEYDLGEATIAVSGRCNVSQVTVDRGDYSTDCTELL